MLSGHLREKNNTYYAVLNCKHSDGKRYSKWVSTGIAVKKGNKRTAEKKLEEFCSTYNEYGKLLCEIQEVQQNTKLTTVGKISSNILFCDYMLTWLSYVETEVDPVTYSGYCNCVENNIYPYFKETGIKLSELESVHLREFYRYERKGDPAHGQKPKKGTTVAHYHASIHAALELALEDKVVGSNAAHKQRPKTERFIGSFYTPEEALECIRAAEGTRLELATLFGFFYGLRRSEIVGLKWQNFDLVNNTFTVAHTVTTYSRKGEPTVVYAKDKTKNASSLRTLPLIPLLFGNCYSRKYLGYIYVNEIGELIKPDYISEAFSNLLEKNGLRHIRFHDTRHSCASLLLRNGVSMKDIQAWLGHSDYSTTANLYAHLDVTESVQLSALSGGELGIRTLGTFRYTAFRVLHLRPLGQLSVSQLYFTTFSLIFNHNFPWHSRSFQEVGKKKGGKNGSTRKMRNQKSQCSCGFAGKKFP